VINIQIWIILKTNPITLTKNVRYVILRPMIFKTSSHETVLFKAPKADSPVTKKARALPSFSEFKAKVDRPAISRFFGLILFIISLTALYLFIGPIVLSEIAFRIRETKKEAVRIVQNQPAPEHKIKFADLLGEVEFETIPAPVDADFGIVIPKINVNSRVVPNIDADSPQEFTQALKVGVAHAAGTAFPDQNGTTFIFGHSTNYAWNVSRYNAIFYQIKDLKIGDEINLFYKGRRFYYKVTDQKVVGAKDTSFLNDHSVSKQLVLQTCWPPGTTKERLLVFAKPLDLLSAK